MNKLFSMFLTSLQVSSPNLKEDFDKLEQLKHDLKRVEERIATAEKNYDLNKAAELKYGIGADILKDIEKVRNDIKNKVVTALNQTLDS